MRLNDRCVPVPALPFTSLPLRRVFPGQLTEGEARVKPLEHRSPTP